MVLNVSLNQKRSHGEHTQLGVAASGKILLTKTGVFCWALALGVRLWDLPKENNCSYSIELFFLFFIL